MADLRPRRPGWHPDPSDPTCVRHWDGEGWQRVRNRPAWSLTTGELVVDTDGLADPTRPGGPPVVEGPVRPAPGRATTSALNVGGEPRSPAARPDRLQPRSATTGPRAGHFPPTGTVGGAAAGNPWVTSKRPMAILGLMVVAAVVAMAAVVGWAGQGRVDPGPLPSSFVAQASTDCTQVLGVRPGTLPSDPLAINAQDDQLSGLASTLRTVAIDTHGNLQANAWLDTWQSFTQTEAARAAALGRGAGDVSTLTLTANDTAAQADHFATTNGLASCTILAASPAAMQAIPS